MVRRIITSAITRASSRAATDVDAASAPRRSVRWMPPASASRRGRMPLLTLVASVGSAISLEEFDLGTANHVEQFGVVAVKHADVCVTLTAAVGIEVVQLSQPSLL